MLPPLQLEESIASTVREEWGRVLAILVKQFGDIQTAEDGLQDAVETAVSVWRTEGLPKAPAAWLVKTARNKIIDRLRRAKRFSELEPEIAYLKTLEADNANDSDQDDVIPDKRLELIFTCCHPALDEKSRTALTLRTLGGLNTEEIARSFLDKPATMAQRLVRAKKKIAATGIPYRIPEAEHLPERLKSVLSVIYLIFNEGYQAHSGESLTRSDLCDEAIRLGRITLQLLPDNSEVQGLLALMLLHDSRRYARQTRQGDFIPLREQNRSQWDRGKIEEGSTLLTDALSRQAIGPYQLQAAITALHAESTLWEETDWAQIAALYTVLYSLNPTPVIKINQAVAVCYDGNAEKALGMLEAVEADGDLQNYQPFHAAKAEVLLLLKREQEAIQSLSTAIKLSDNNSERTYLEKRLRLLESKC